MEENKWYFRSLGNRDFGFVEEIDGGILETDIPITEEEHQKFFELNSQGKEFREKEVHTGVGLFDLIEEYKSEQPVPVAGLEEYILDLEYRISKNELGV